MQDDAKTNVVSRILWPSYLDALTEEWKGVKDDNDAKRKQRVYYVSGCWLVQAICGSGGLSLDRVSQPMASIPASKGKTVWDAKAQKEHRNSHLTTRLLCRSSIFYLPEVLFEHVPMIHFASASHSALLRTSSIPQDRAPGSFFQRQRQAS